MEEKMKYRKQRKSHYQEKGTEPGVRSCCDTFCLFLYASSYLFKRVCMSVRLSVRPSVCPSVRPFVHPSVGRSVTAVQKRYSSALLNHWDLAFPISCCFSRIERLFDGPSRKSRSSISPFINHSNHKYSVQNSYVQRHSQDASGLFHLRVRFLIT